MKLSVRQLACESLETRILLSASCDDRLPELTDIGAVADVGHQITATASRVAYDGSFDSARNLGKIGDGLAVRDSIGGADSSDYFKLDIANRGTIDIDLNQPGFGTRLYLVDSQRNVVDSRMSLGESRLGIAANLDAGTYYLVVSSWSFFRTPYQLNVGWQDSKPTPRDSAGNTLRGARQLGSVDGTISLDEFVGGSDTADVYEFSVPAAARISTQLTRLNADVDVYLLDRQGQSLTRSTRAGSTSENIAGTLAAGAYYLVVAPYRSNESTYHLSISSSLVDPPTSPLPPATNPPATSRPSTDPPATNPPITNPPPSDSPRPLPDVGYFGGASEWNLNAVGAPESWTAGYTGQDTVVAVLDTGVDLDHFDLNDNIWVNSDEIRGDGIDNDRNGFIDDIVGWNFIGHNANPNDVNGHGTHVTGIIGSERNGSGSTGVAYDATIMPVKVLGDDGSGSDYSVARGIRYAVDNGADVINMSLGGGGNSRTIRSALEYALANNVFVVIASGNEYCEVPAYPAMYSRDLDNVISVGAHDRGGKIANFSNDVGTSRAIQIDAPGVGIYSTLPNDRFGQLSGTSMAAPHVAGVAALALSANHSMSAADLKAVLTGGSDRTIRDSDALGGTNAANTVSRARSSTFRQTGSGVDSAAVQSGFVVRQNGTIHDIAVVDLGFVTADQPARTIIRRITGANTVEDRQIVRERILGEFPMTEVFSTRSRGPSAESVDLAMADSTNDDRVTNLAVNETSA